jgi:uncharacterized protein (TIGR03083 family)
MAAVQTYVPVVHLEADRLARFLDTLSTDAWQRQSACDLWTVRDVVAHLIWAADFYTDTVSRGIQGDSSLPADRPPRDAPEPAGMPAYFVQHAMKVRDHVGAALIPTFRTSSQALSQLMSSFSPQEWDMPCAFFRHDGGRQAAQVFLLLSIQELAIRSWDIRSRFDDTASLCVESLPALLERLPGRFRLPGLAHFPIDSTCWPLVRYQFNLQADRPRRYDLVVEGGKARLEPSASAPADVTLHCDQATFVLMMYKRLTLAPTGSRGHVTLEGDESLVEALGQWLQQS